MLAKNNLPVHEYTNNEGFEVNLGTEMGFDTLLMEVHEKIANEACIYIEWMWITQWIIFNGECIFKSNLKKLGGN